MQVTINSNPKVTVTASFTELSAELFAHPNLLQVWFVGDQRKKQDRLQT